jgi:hypothetical protein
MGHREPGSTDEREQRDSAARDRSDRIDIHQVPERDPASEPLATAVNGCFCTRPVSLGGCRRRVVSDDSGIEGGEPISPQGMTRTPGRRSGWARQATSHEGSPRVSLGGRIAAATALVTALVLVSPPS